ncbi:MULTISPECIES: small acid-soluble spore protein H [Paenibacillus]|uniref:Small acid-soluble spore protein H n=1 Tax=Paenibacillus rhizophilus TaxID=1850366 RepID=A0A3N9PBD9_9BACL|nr:MULTISPECIES: small acid-soluble spore protein H [Paenibacillus]RQW12567.1 small acid-soluble spore protein H [Paenibacillus rhizophilus]BCG58529.1 small, acid-soluble spore protein H [Paenibacillus sp. URB8-2]
MNTQRAQEIAASPIMENVTYEGTQIYIQHVDENTDMARIYPLNQPEKEQTVPVRNLIEQ